MGDVSQGSWDSGSKLLYYHGGVSWLIFKQKDGKTESKAVGMR